MTILSRRNGSGKEAAYFAGDELRLTVQSVRAAALARKVC